MLKWMDCSSRRDHQVPYEHVVEVEFYMSLVASSKQVG
jgi:hypothetical protein